MLAGRLIEETCARHDVRPEVLTLHSDRGSPMTSKCTAQLLADLGVTQSLSRPQVSDDNPFSEAQFKTLKYHPGFPKRFDDNPTAQRFCRSFFPWYNHDHRHGGLEMLTPADVHHGRIDAVLARKQAALDAAFEAHPERFVNGRPLARRPPAAVYINRPQPPTHPVAEQAASATAGGQGTSLATTSEASLPLRAPGDERDDARAGAGEAH